MIFRDVFSPNLKNVIDQYEVHCDGSTNCDIYQKFEDISAMDVVRLKEVKCFSGVSRVELEDEKVIKIEELRVGDKVKTANGYETVYGFGHYNKYDEVDMLQIHTAISPKYDGPIEMSQDHFIFLKHRPDPVPAAELKVGDTILSENGPQVVTKIKSIRRKGYYHPYTGSGTIVVNGIIASVHAFGGTFLKNSFLFQDYKLFGVFTLQSLAQIATFLPNRFLCLHMGLGLCHPSKQQAELGYQGPVERLFGWVQVKIQSEGRQFEVFGLLLLVLIVLFAVAVLIASILAPYFILVGVVNIFSGFVSKSWRIFLRFSNKTKKID